ncbi:MAG: hypothetical protein GF398_19890 [Chitinivibrionales bacterium]|nr:hypothetical protein [Chitinivibrionales bacterium]
MHKGTRLICLLVCLTTAIPANWPVDGEDFGTMGCRFFQFQGEWEMTVNLADKEQNTEAVCITVAVASIINYYRWPAASFFDGVNAIYGNIDTAVPIRYTWDFPLINGPVRPLDCADDDPAQRRLPHDTLHTGAEEIRRLIYAVERAYGNIHDIFKTDKSQCGGEGLYGVEHLMRNRFGYPDCRTLPIANPKTKNKVIKDLSAGKPVIAMKCDHVYVLDGFRVNRATGEASFHSCDYVMADSSMGWFPWGKFKEEGLSHVVVDIIPSTTLRAQSPRKRIVYKWGDDYLPYTSNSERKGFIEVISPAGLPLGNLNIALHQKHFDRLLKRVPPALPQHSGWIAQDCLRIPTTGFFELPIDSCMYMYVDIVNKNRYARRVGVIFHDFEYESTESGF